MSTDDAADYAKAKEWLKALTGQVLRLRMDHRVWEEVQAMIVANPELHRPSEFYRWAKDMYVSGMAMAIRRQTEDDTRSVSFYRFLKLIKGNPSLVSRRRYRTLFHDDDEFVEQLNELGLKKDYINGDYDRFVGAGKMQPLPADIQIELDELDRVTAKFVAFADKVIAHHDERKPDDLPKFSEVDEAIRFFESLIKHYRCSLTLRACRPTSPFSTIGRRSSGCLGFRSGRRARSAQRSATHPRRASHGRSEAWQ